jgi:pyochelin biosynthesis protein PchC
MTTDTGPAGRGDPAADDDRWIRRYRPSGERRVQLVCFPHAGGSATFYLPLARAVPPEVETLAVQYPGRLDRYAEPCVDDIGELADRVTAALAGRLDRPAAFFGHSMGAVVAFEVARRFAREGREGPVVLFASGRRAPTRVRDEKVHLLDDDGIVERLGRLDGTDSQVLGDEEMLRMVLPAVRADYRAIETYRYRPGPALDCPIVTLVGDADPLTTLDEAAAWAEHTTAGFEQHVFTGGHFYLAAHQAEVTGTVLRRLEPWSGGAGARPPAP